MATISTRTFRVALLHDISEMKEKSVQQLLTDKAPPSVSRINTAIVNYGLMNLWLRQLRKGF